MIYDLIIYDLSNFGSMINYRLNTIITPKSQIK